jgi:flavin reductase (DIM6/NTAB) family NADH-FMN oxidoreductase RutF
MLFHYDIRASEQVSELKKVCISTVHASSYNETYRLGKNHMQRLRPIETFEVFSEKSEQLKLPLPQSVLAYHELEWMKHIDIGIHRLHFFRILNRKIVQSDSPSLAHIHASYAMWRKRHGLEIQFLLR